VRIPRGLEEILEQLVLIIDRGQGSSGLGSTNREVRRGGRKKAVRVQ
jgi:hypothetical protein